MIQARTAADSISGALWFPGKKMEGLVVAPLSARALDIAKSREDLFELLHDLPESEYELSLTDLVEKGSAASNQATNKNTCLHEGELQKTIVIKERKKRTSRSSFGSSSSGDGVLLNFYMPASLSRSLTTPRSSRRPASLVIDCNKRDGELRTLGCLSAIWRRGRGKSRRSELERMT
ncbi:hypothetical protein Cni_G07732 [Canna indica]|uniref:Uncharacterized protein n=1 Tax=Canna indica TaxID=4628 RepID=A0AAQ3K4J7_9LILI|nr:hypothetical protein Cni_G07732 [Canna indica]